MFPFTASITFEAVIIPFGVFACQSEPTLFSSSTGELSYNLTLLDSIFSPKALI